jgi:hypothetical protein
MDMPLLLALMRFEDLHPCEALAPIDSMLATVCVLLTPGCALDRRMNDDRTTIERR